MGANSTDALHEFLRDYLSRCTVKGGKIVTPDDKPVVFDPTGGGHRLPTAPPVGEQVNGRPDYKRGQ